MAGTIYPFVQTILKTRIAKNDCVLEIGCGSMQYRPLVSGTYEGLDLPTSPYLDEPPHYCCSAEEIPCEDGRFNLVFGVATFLIINDIDRAFTECRRVLCPGGRLVIFDYQKHICKRLRHVDPIHRHVWNFDDLKQRLENAGFEPDHICDITDEADLRGSFRRALSWVLPWLRQAPDWLIVDATVAKPSI